jgi:hypothetical protein
MARRPNAYSQLIQEASPATEAQESGKYDTENTARPQIGNTLNRQNRNILKSGSTVKITIYPTQQQLEKLYDLMDAYRKKTGARINQQDLLRRLIEVADINTLLP